MPQVQTLSQLVQAVQSLSLARTVDDVAMVVRGAARRLTGADGATFVLRDGDFCRYLDEDAIAPLWRGRRFPIEACISGWTMLNREAAVIEDIYADRRVPVGAYRQTFVKSLVMVPIRRDEPIGAIGNYWAVTRTPTASEVEALQALADATSVAMENVRLIAELEQRVVERTAQLELANRDLEAFSYSVSHDLRAPLRAIVGFGEALQRDLDGKLDPRSRDYLQRMTRAAGRMGELITDLLDLSRVARGEAARQRVELSAMVREIGGELAAQYPERAVELRIAAGMVVTGDASLLRLALGNLLSNAWKFTGKRADARVEVAPVEAAEGRQVVVVRDNGIGFDMAYAERLFTPFQRLTEASTFPGNGIGLSIVERVARRHGGRVWVEATPGEGAAFYLELPD